MSYDNRSSSFDVQREFSGWLAYRRRGLPMLEVVERALTSAMATGDSESGLSSSLGSGHSSERALESGELRGYSYDSSGDEGVCEWDILGRMSSKRRSSQFDRPLISTVTLVRGDSGSYGLEIQGNCPPIIVQATLPTREGVFLKPGDRLLEVNGENVRSLSHSEVGKLISDCPHSVTLLVSSPRPPSLPQGSDVHSGWLWKRGGTGLTPRNWRRRWFVVRDDCIAYYYATPEDTTAKGAIVLSSYTVTKASDDPKRPFSFKLRKGGGREYHISTDSEAEMNKWAQIFTEAATQEGRESVHFSGTAHNVSLSALSIRDPDCHGFLHKQGFNVRSWKKRYCVLKGHQLFYYGQMHHTTAYGVMNLQGYSVAMGDTKDKKFYFEARPPGSHLRTYYFYSDSAAVRDRWLAALQTTLAKANTHFPNQYDP